MVITILVIGILTAVVAPTYVSALADYRATSAARRIVADLQFARAEAQRKSTARTVTFDTTNEQYTLVGVTDTDNSANTYTISLVEDPFAAALVTADFGGDAQVIFDIYGRPDSSGSVVVQAGGTQRTVNLAADGSATMP